MDVKNVTVIGSGQMGNGIAHVFAVAGFGVRLVDVDKAALDGAIALIKKNMDRQVKKEILTAEARDAALGRLKTGDKVADAADCELVIEAVPERLELKQKIFAELDKACAPGTILASNTSSLPIGSLAEATGRAPKVIGMHFMNPVPMMKLVELIRGDATSDETYETIRALTEKLGKIPATSRDVPGFIANRILMPMINEACWTLHEGVGTKEDIDTVMKIGMNHPMGPLKLADFSGLDTCEPIMNVLYEGLGHEKYKPCPLFAQMVKKGHLGAKTGQGFYDWTKKK